MELENYLLISCASISWEINIDASTKTTSLKSVSNFKLLNPYWNSVAYSNAGFLKDISIHQNSARFSTTGMIFRVEKSSYDLETVIGKLNKFFQYLRYSSNQFSFQGKDSFINTLTTQPRIIKGVIDTCKCTDRMVIRSDYYHSQITWNNIKEADKLIKKNYQIPVWEDIMLDAINDRYRSEYRKSILYAVVAIEAMMSDTYDNEYHKLQSKANYSSRYRFIEYNNLLSDPVYKALTSATNFKRLLHEIPLYLMGKSLLISDNQLYQEALKLYTTRNKIVHRGEPTEIQSRDTFTIDRDGAFKALRVAIEIFEWLGNDKFAHFKQVKFINLT